MVDPLCIYNKKDSLRLENSNSTDLVVILLNNDKNILVLGERHYPKKFWTKSFSYQWVFLSLN